MKRALLLVLLMGVAFTAHAQTKKLLRIHTAGPNDTNVDNTKLAVEFQDRANAAQSSVEVKVFPASQLGQTREVIEAMRADSGVELASLKVDGGMVVNETLMQFQSDILAVPVIRPVVNETTALGAAYAAGLAVGFWESEDDIRANWAVDKTWEPAMDEAESTRLYAEWNKAVERTYDWA